MSSTNNRAAHRHCPSYNDLALRPPVPLPQCSGNAKQHDASIKPRMAMLLVSCQVLKLSMETTFTAACLLHRCILLGTITLTAATETVAITKYTDESTTDGGCGWEWTTACIIFIACKTEEEHRRLRDLINLTRMLTSSSSSLLTSKKDDDESQHAAPQTTTTTTTNTATLKDGNYNSEPHTIISLLWMNSPPKLDDEYWKDKERIVKAEQTVLRQLAFDVHVAHPHRLVILLVEDCLADYWHNNNNNEKNDDKDAIAMNTKQSIFTKVIVEDTWKLLNTCVFSVAALQQSTLSLAVAALDLTVQQTDDKPQIPLDWWKEVTGLSQESKDKATQILQSMVLVL